MFWKIKTSETSETILILPLPPIRSSCTNFLTVAIPECFNKGINFVITFEFYKETACARVFWVED